jgi:hypothetical protein
MLLMNSSTWLRRKVLRLFATNPSLFTKLISMHTQQANHRDMMATDFAALTWRVLWA